MAEREQLVSELKTAPEIQTHNNKSTTITHTTYNAYNKYTTQKSSTKEKQPSWTHLILIRAAAFNILDAF